MGFLDFLKKNPPASVPESPPLQPTAGFGSATLTDQPPRPDTFLTDLEEHHELADDLFSPTPATKPVPMHEEPWTPTPPRSPEPAPLFSPPEPIAVSAPTSSVWSQSIPVTPEKSSSLPDFSEEDIAALEDLEHTVEAAARAPPQLIGMDIPEIAQAPVMPAIPEFRPTPPAPRVAPAPVPMVEDLPSLPDAPAMENASPYMSADDYLGVTEAIRSVRRAVRKGDDALRDALARHEDLGTQYARAASDIASVEDRLRDLDNALFER